MAMGRLLELCGVLVFLDTESPMRARDFGRGHLIAHLDVNADLDECIKGPAITTARAEIHGLRATIGPPPREWPTPCCYARKPLHIR